jgi:serine protease AprX
MGWSRYALFFILIAVGTTASAQKNRYMVFFQDKTGTPYSIAEPSGFLSAKAIERRVRHNVPVAEADLPVNPAYIAGVRATGAEVYFKTRWMNGVMIQAEPGLVDDIAQLSYVKSVNMVAPGASLSPNGRLRPPKAAGKTKSPKAEVTDLQLEMIGIDDMHQDGFRGEGIYIAILDAGFSGVDSAEPFAHIFSNSRIDLDLSQDFVYNSGTVFNYDDHGTEVFSVIAGLQSGAFTGGAPAASFQLYVTEEVPTEYPVEEYNWLFAAERADSSGVDIIQSSLGYYDFDGNSFDYSKTQMDGKTAVSTRAAQMAADRGIVVVLSAGNEGNNSWQIITAPADAEDVLAVASVNNELIRANSSSIGPSADNRIKPDVAALGVSTSVVAPNGTITKSSGTSFAAPLITSLAAGLLQRYPYLTNAELMFAIRNSASQAFLPDKYLGYGIPDYERIVGYLDKTLTDDLFAVYPNPSFIDSIVIKPLYPEEVASCKVELISVDGKAIANFDAGFSRENPMFTKSLLPIASGAYFVRIHWNARTFLYRFVKG